MAWKSLPFVYWESFLFFKKDEKISWWWFQAYGTDETTAQVKYLFQYSGVSLVLLILYFPKFKKKKKKENHFIIVNSSSLNRILKVKICFIISPEISYIKTCYKTTTMQSSIILIFDIDGTSLHSFLLQDHQEWDGWLRSDEALQDICSVQGYCLGLVYFCLINFPQHYWAQWEIN